MAIMLEFSTLPYPGLRPFRDGESDIFFGREAQIDQLLVRLSRNHFLAVTGPSGCGKSSLIKAGMIPALSAGFMVEGGSRWRICELRPGDRPLGRLARAMASADILGADRTSLESLAFIEATLRRGPLGLIEIVRGAEALEHANLLVMIDQFEEIFRYRDRIAVDEADAFVALLLASALQTEVAIYVVITMRSDYLGDCALFHGLPEAISDAQYLTPRLTREDLELAIAGPARVFGGRVEPRLVNRLINDFGTDPDQLPLLQHALARLWNIAPAKPPVLTVKDYQAIGGLGAALSNHGDEILAELTPGQQRIAEIMFRRLSGTQDGRRDVRAPARIGEIARIAGVEPDAVIGLADAFRRADRCFLWAPEGPLDENTLLDLSHESLIRQWDRLADWAGEEAKSAENYQRLRDWAQRWEQGNAELPRGADLATAVAWRQRAAPNEAWAERYGGRDQFRLAMKFLDHGEEAQRAAVAAEEAARQRQSRRGWRLAWGFAGTTAALLAGIVVYCLLYVWDYPSHYKNYVTARGIPQGIDPLTAAESGHRNSSYKITTEGVSGRVQSMELVNSAGHLGSGLFAITASPEENADQPFRWEYGYDPKGNIAYEVALNGQRQRITTTFYAPAGSELVSSRKAHVIKGSGSLAHEKSSCAAFIEYHYSPRGYITQTHYYDQNGNSAPGKNGAFIEESKYDDFGRIIESTSLGKDGRPMNDIDGNATERKSYDNQGNLTSIEYLDASGNPSDSEKNNFVHLMNTYDDYGNLSGRSAERANGEPYIFGGSCKTIKFRSDGHGNPVEGSCLRQDNKLSKSSFATFQNQFDSDDQMIENTSFDGDGHRVLGPDGAFRERVSYDSDGNVREWWFYDTDDILISKKISEFRNGHEIRAQYRDAGGRLMVLGKEGFAAVSKEYDAQGNEKKTTYLGVDDKPVFNRTEGYAIKTVSYDSCGRAIETRFLGADGDAVRTKEGYTGIRQSYGENNKVTDEIYLDDKDQPGPSMDGYTHVVREFDRNRNKTDERYFDGEGKPFLVKGAYVAHKSRYDYHNNLVEEEYLGASGQSVVNDHGWAKHTRGYDERNALIEEAWFGPDGKPILIDEGYALMTSVNDAHGRDVETRWFGIDGKPLTLNKGYAKRTRRYDEDGNLMEEAYFGTEAEPVVSEDGYARAEHVYDPLGREIERAHFGIHGEKVIETKKGYHRARAILNDTGKILEFAAFGPDDKPLLLKEGYSRIAMQYDPHGYLVETAYFGVNGEPIVGDAGYSSATWEYDRRGNVIKEAYFGVDGKPMVGKNGYAKYSKLYNAYDDPIAEDYFGTDGEPVAGNKGYARVTRIYDRAGRMTEEGYFGTDRKPIRQKNGYATVKYGYDDLGREIERSYYGIQSEPDIGKDDNSYHRATRKLDLRGNPLEFATFGLDGEPVEVVDPDSGRRCARLVKRFDAKDKQIDSQCFDAAGMPVPKQ